VREALIRLAEAGLVKALPQRGTVVTKIALSSVQSGRFLREAVERAVIRDAALRADDQAVAAMERIINDQEIAASREDHAAFLALDDDLHYAFAASIGYGGVWTTLQHIKLQMDRVRYLSLPDATPAALLIHQHRAIVAAMRKHDADRAEGAMREHLSEVLSSLPRLVQRLPNYFETGAAS
jgi:DNA-binding GntR family transcriptional regulator